MFLKARLGTMFLGVIENKNIFYDCLTIVIPTQSQLSKKRL